jgi:signal transduction histidine kinase
LRWVFKLFNVFSCQSVRKEDGILLLSLKVFKNSIWLGFLVGMLVYQTLPGYAQNVLNGRGDFSHADVQKNGAISLDGQWEFYWNELLTPADLQSNPQKTWIQVPGSWHRQGNFSSQGYATYRVRIALPMNHYGLAIYFPVINASARIWINGELVHESGRVSSDSKQYKPQLSSTLIPLPEKIAQADIVLQVANYDYFSGGIAGTPKLDRSASIFSQMNRANGVENFFAGSLIAMFVYQLILYFLFHRGKPYLWLGLICLGVALRAMIVHGGSFLLPNLFPHVGWEVWKKIEFGSVYAIVCLFPLYIYHLFKEDAPRKPIFVFVTTSIFLCLAVLFTPQYTYGKLLEIAHLGLLMSFIYAIYSISRSWRAGNQDARIILVGVLASFPFILAEIVKNSRFFPINIEFMYLVEMGVLVFLLFQVYLLANHYANSFKKLEALNLNLEKIVEERSGELITANEVKDRLLSVMSHDIKSPLNSLRGVLQIYNKGAISQDEFVQMTQHIEGDLSKTSILVENILYWTASQLRGVQLRVEDFALFQLMEENMQLFKTIAANKNIQLSHNAPKSLVIRFDRNILNLVIRNLISNAIKFSFEGSKVEVQVKEQNQSLQIQVKDQGVGMDESTLETLLAPELVVSTSGTGNEKGTGLGLSLCRQYLQQAGGELRVESVKGSGSTFYITLPLAAQ